MKARKRRRAARQASLRGPGTGRSSELWGAQGGHGGGVRLTCPRALVYPPTMICPARPAVVPPKPLCNGTFRPPPAMGHPCPHNGTCHSSPPTLGHPSEALRWYRLSPPQWTLPLWAGRGQTSCKTGISCTITGPREEQTTPLQNREGSLHHYGRGGGVQAVPSRDGVGTSCTITGWGFRDCTITGCRDTDYHYNMGETSHATKGCRGAQPVPWPSRATPLSPPAPPQTWPRRASRRRRRSPFSRRRRSLSARAWRSRSSSPCTYSLRRRRDWHADSRFLIIRCCRFSTFACTRGSPGGQRRGPQGSQERGMPGMTGDTQDRGASLGEKGDTLGWGTPQEGQRTLGGGILRGRVRVGVRGHAGGTHVNLLGARRSGSRGRDDGLGLGLRGAGWGAGGRPAGVGQAQEPWQQQLGRRQ